MEHLINPCSQVEYPAYTASYDGTAGNTSAWAQGPELVWVWSDSGCYVEVGVGAVATTSSTPIPPGVHRAFKVPLNSSGAPWRVSAIMTTAPGNIFAKPANR